MNVGLWIAPAVLAGLALFLWFATRLERLVAPQAFDAGLPIPAVLDSGFTDTTARPESLSIDGQFAAELERGSGISMFLIAVGAILYFAVSVSVSGISLSAVGVILMIVGAGGLVISLVTLGTARARDRRTTVVQGTIPVQGSTTVVQEGAR